MRAEDARRMVGSRVIATTSLWGKYVGTLEQVHSSPWRARVLITGVLRHAARLPDGTAQRGFRPGEFIEVGGVCCHPAPDDVVGGTYLESLHAQWMAMQAELGMIGPADTVRLRRLMKQLNDAMTQERERVGHAVDRQQERACGACRGPAVSGMLRRHAAAAAVTIAESSDEHLLYRSV